MSSCDIIYLGYSDSKGNPEAPNWKPVPNTPEAITQGIAEGYTAKTILSLSHEPEKDKPEPVRRGPLVFDFDCKEDPCLGIMAGKNFVARFCYLYQIQPYWLRYWISGGKGCHIEIPAQLMGSEEGHPQLHNIYLFMANLLAKQCLSIISGQRGSVDMQLYCGGKGKLLRIENIRRPNGRYKVPVTAAEFWEMTPGQLMNLTQEPREISENISIPAERSERLAFLYNENRKNAEDILPEKRLQILEGISKCAFLTKCIENPETLTEPEWWAFISILATLGKSGKSLVLQCSRPYPGFSEEESWKKIHIAEEENKPKTCAYIREQRWVNCNPDCALHSPCQLFRKEYSKKKVEEFIHFPDGLYFQRDNEHLKVCTPIQVIGVGSAFDDWGWCRVVEITDQTLCKKQLILPMKDFADQGTKWLATLLDGGLILEAYPKARQLLYQYITKTTEHVERIRISEKIGWMSNGSYLFPDICYGTDVPVLYSGGMETKFRIAGTLEDWQNAVGTYCSGNPLLVLATSFALTGPLLELTFLEGGGMHIYGGSSTGKSTIAITSGSVCGGGGPDGFITQWRTTDNALEKIAAAHNDNFLVLDEVGQAHCAAVYKIIYMLANRQGKMRMTSDCKQRKPFVWNLNFLSTGEMTIGDKIREDGRLQPMAGQEVRVIDIPIDSGLNENPFIELHGFSTSGELSNHLKATAKKIYGAPVRAFIEMLTRDKLEMTQAILTQIGIFYKENMPEKASQQVQRVLMKFALTAACGELAIEKGIFPYKKGEASKAAAKYFKVWIAQRNGLQDGEILAAVERIQSHFEACKAAYIELDNEEFFVRQGQSRREAPGYKFSSGRDIVYFVLSATMRPLFGAANRKAVMEELERRGWLALNHYGKPLESKCICGQNVRGIGFIPAKIQ